MKYLALVVAIWFATPTFAQQVGSQAAYRAMAGAQRRAADAQMAWQQSKKLGYVLPPIAPHEQHECMSPDGLAEGKIGLLDNWQFEILQIVDDRNLIITHPRFHPLWLADFSTKGCVDGEKVRLVGYLQVKGAKTYETALGTQKTVRRIRFLTHEESAAIEKQKAEERAAKEAAQAAAEEAKLYRTWTDDSGKYHFDAKLVDLKSGVLTLEAKDGSQREVRVSRVSKEDRDWVRDEMKKRREAPKTTESEK